MAPHTHTHTNTPVRYPAVPPRHHQHNIHTNLPHPYPSIPSQHVCTAQTQHQPREPPDCILPLTAGHFTTVAQACCPLRSSLDCSPSTPAALPAQPQLVPTQKLSDHTLGALVLEHPGSYQHSLQLASQNCQTHTVYPGDGPKPGHTFMTRRGRVALSPNLSKQKQRVKQN